MNLPLPPTPDTTALKVSLSDLRCLLSCHARQERLVKLPVFKFFGKASPQEVHPPMCIHRRTGSAISFVTIGSGSDLFLCNSHCVNVLSCAFCCPLLVTGHLPSQVASSASPGPVPLAASPVPTPASSSHHQRACPPLRHVLLFSLQPKKMARASADSFRP